MLRPLDLASLPAALAGLVPLLLALVLGGCQKDAPRDVRKLEGYGLVVETPTGWTGGGAGGTFEYRSADGSARLRVGPLEGVPTASGLRDTQLMAGTGATPSARSLPPSPTKVGPLAAERGRFSGSDGRIYDVVAVQTARGVVLFQASVTAERAQSDQSAVESLFTGIRQSIQPLK